MNERATGNWSARPWAARWIRAVVFAGPLIVSVALAWVASSVAPRPDSFLVALARWLVIAGLSTFVLVVLDKLARRLLPLAALFNLTLAFPDQAPSRYQLALRRGSTGQLRERIAEARAGRLGDTPAEAAERVLELVMALSVHDRLTRGHSERVRAYTEMIGEELGLTPKELDQLRWAGLLHDVGKLMVGSEILNKPGRLSTDEFEIIKQHPEFGRQLVAPIAGWLGDSARAVWEHHERWDGRGYPAGLSGLDISLAGRIVSVADAYDVMTSVRSYQKPVSSADARAELARCSGTQFDPAVVRAFLNISLGRLRFAMGPLSWLAQLPLLPTALAAGASQGVATAATAVVGAAAASMGVGLSGEVLPPSPPAEAYEFGGVPGLRDPIEIDTSARTATVASGAGAPAVAGDPSGAEADAGSAAPAPDGSPGGEQRADDAVTGEPAAPGDTTTTTVEGDTAATSSTTSTSLAARTTTTTVAGGGEVRTATTTVAPVQPAAVTTSTSIAPVTTTLPPTTVAAATTTTTVAPAAPGSRPGWLPAAGVPTAFHLDVPNTVTLPAAMALKTQSPTRRNAVTFDPDADGWAGLSLAHGGPGASWGWGGPQAARTYGATAATVHISSREVVPVSVAVRGRLEVCDGAGACSPVAETVTPVTVGLVAIPVTLDFGTIDAVIPGGGTLRLTVEVPADSPADAVFYADTRTTPSAITLTFP